MFVVTNREVLDGSTDPQRAFGARINPKGPNELRLAWAEREGKRWRVEVLPDEVTDAMAAEVGLLPRSARAADEPPVFASQYAARKILARLQPSATHPKGRNLLFFVHGFNNDMTSVLDRAEQFEANYGVEVIPFSWPANGGGFKGVASYKSDKRDALASTGALDRALTRLSEILAQINQERVARIEAEAEARFGAGAAQGADAERWDRFFATAARKECPFRINLLLHSMGNYVYKHLLRSSSFSGNVLVFDNVVMVAADTNNAGHAEWVDRIQCRGRVFVTLNENDSALAASRMKMGEQQLARLGHWPHRLDARQAVYVDFTGQAHVGDSHAYFEGKPLNNKQVRQFFMDALNGAPAEAPLRFDVGRNMYRF